MTVLLKAATSMHQRLDTALYAFLPQPWRIHWVSTTLLFCGRCIDHDSQPEFRHTVHMTLFLVARYTQIKVSTLGTMPPSLNVLGAIVARIHELIAGMEVTKQMECGKLGSVKIAKFWSI